MSFLYLVLLGLATCRLSTMFVSEDGPMHIFKRIREWAEIQDVELPNGDVKKFVIDEENNLIGGILSCTWCSSVWFSGILLLIYLLSPKLGILFATWLSGSMVSIMISVIIERLQDANKDNDNV